MDEPARLGDPVGGVTVLLREILPPDDVDDAYYGGSYVVAVEGEVTAAVTAAFGVRGELGDFLAGLAADFRGWTGLRTWESFWGELSVSATHEPLGRVCLRWALQTRDWTVTATTLSDAGEDMRAMAAAVRALEQH